MKVKVTFTKHVVKEMEADNFQDAAYRAALELPKDCFISNIEEIRETKQDKVSDLFHQLGEMFNPNKK